MKTEPVNIEKFYDEANKYLKKGKSTKINDKFESYWTGIDDYTKKVKIELQKSVKVN